MVLVYRCVYNGLITNCNNLQLIVHNHFFCVRMCYNSLYHHRRTMIGVNIPLRIKKTNTDRRDIILQSKIYNISTTHVTESDPVEREQQVRKFLFVAARNFLQRVKHTHDLTSCSTLVVIYYATI